MQVIFYLAATALVATYLVYPLILLLLSPISRHDACDYEVPDQNVEWPRVSIIVSAYNEEKSIDRRISNLLASSYPGRKEVVVVSDGSADRTVEIISKRAGDVVRLHVLPTRVGKGLAQNLAISNAQGEVLILTDADCEFCLQPDAITELVRPFCDPTVGLVTGVVTYTDSPLANLYRCYDDFLRRLESRHGVIAGALGPIYAMRKSLWKPAAANVMTDFFHPILTCLEGSRAVVVSRARAVTGVGQEFNRQIRMVARAALVYFSTFGQLLRSRRWWCLSVLTCHKLLRWLTMPFFVLLLVSSLELSASGGLFRIVLIAQLAFLTLAALGRIASTFGLPAWFDAAYRFAYLNCAAAIGLTWYLFGRIPVVWEPRSK